MGCALTPASISEVWWIWNTPSQFLCAHRRRAGFENRTLHVVLLPPTPPKIWPDKKGFCFCFVRVSKLPPRCFCQKNFRVSKASSWPIRDLCMLPYVVLSNVRI